MEEVNENQITISVRGKIATLEKMDFEMVGGNSDYKVVFDFDEEWEKYSLKTALFVYGDTPIEKVFSGNVCEGVAVYGATMCLVGVYSGDIATTTPACISGIRQSIKDVAENAHEAPTEDVYNQIIELLNKYIEQGGGGSGGSGENGKDGFSPTVSITPIENGHRVTITDINGDHSFDVLNGEKGADGNDYVLTEADKAEIGKAVRADLADILGDIDTALDELHNYAQNLVNGGAIQ